MRGEQQQRVKVRVDREDADEDIAEPIPPGRLAQKSDQEGGRERCQQEEDSVAPRFLSIADAVGVECEQSGRDQRDSPVIELPGQPVNRRQRCYGHQHRKAADEELALQVVRLKPQPDPQQRVVQRHVGFAPPQQAQEISPVDPRDFHTETLIKPEGLAREE